MIAFRVRRERAGLNVVEEALQRFSCGIGEMGILAHKAGEVVVMHAQYVVEDEYLAVPMWAGADANSWDSDGGGDQLCQHIVHAFQDEGKDTPPPQRSSRPGTAVPRLDHIVTAAREDHPGQRPDPLVVLDQEDGLRAAAGPGLDRGGFAGEDFVGTGQVDPERGAAPRFAVHLDEAARLLDNAVDGGQAQPRQPRRRRAHRCDSL